MNQFSSRSTQSELIDQPGIPFSDWELCLKELDKVNTLLGGHSISVEGVRKLAGKITSKITIAEIGCGGGDNLNAIARKNRNRDIAFYGIDINEACTVYAKKNCREIDAQFICSDYRQVDFGNDKPDIIFNSLFCHHFSDQQLVEMLVWMKKNSKLGFFINDLHRHPFAYRAITLLTHLFSKSYLVKNDGPVSVLRGFRKQEWRELLTRAGIDHYEIGWRWAFRYLVLYRHG